MKWYAGLIAAAAVMLLIALGIGRTATSSPRIGDGGIRVVAGLDRPAAAPPARPPRPDVSIVADPPSIARTTPAAGPDAMAITALFDGQTRDPAWAPGAEAEIRSRLSAGADVRCAEFMCRVVMPMPADPAAVTPDEQADAATRDWPVRLSYNRLTAAVIDGPGKPALAFYATRAMEADRIADDR